MESITLQVGSSIISSGDALGQVQFAASAESDGGASRYIVGRVYGEAEGAFSASSNPASIVFATSAADNLPASGKIKISHEGHILPLKDNTYDLGSPALRFRNLHLASGIVSTGTFDTVLFNTAIGDIDQVPGQLNWNSEAGTLELGLTNDLKIALGQSLLFRVKNSTGSALSKGQAVYASGVLGGGQVIQAAPFATNHNIPEVRFIGLMTDDLANGDDGFVNNFGHIKNVDLRTSNTALNPNGETWAIGDILFVDDTTPGGLTKVQPQDDIYVALVLADGQNGELFVRITDPGHINDLHDVNTSGLVDNNFLVWNSGLEYWEPSTSLTFNGTTLHTDTDGISAIFGRNNSQTNGGKVRIYVDDADTASSVQAIKAFNNKTTGTNYGINATANGSGATKNVGLYGWAAQAATNWGLWVNAGDSIFDDRVGINTYSPAYDLHVNGSGYVVNDFNIGGSSNIGGNVIVGGNVTIQGTTVTANVSSMEIEDPIFTLGQASGTIVTDTNLDRGLALVLSTGTTAFMGWDTSEGEFSLLSSGVATNASGNYSPGTYGNLHIAGLTASTANFSSTIDAANLGVGEDNSVVILDSDGKLRTDEIDSRVWGSSLVGGSGNLNYVTKWTSSSGIGNSQIWDNGLYVGIGIGNPSERLVVNGNIQTVGLGSKIILNGSQGLEDPGNGSDLIIRTVNGERIRVLDSGNVGIGISTPSDKLHVYTTTSYDGILVGGSTTPSVTFDGSGSYIDWRIGNAGSNVNSFTIADGTSGSNERFLISESGYVGIGTSSPGYKLDVNGTANFSSTINAASLGAGEDNSVVILDSDGKLRTDEIDSRVWGTSLVDGAGSASGVAFWTDSNTLSYDSGLMWDSGNNRLGIGTTSPVYDLDVRTNGNNALYVAQGAGARYLAFGTTGFINNTTLAVSKGTWNNYASIEVSTTIASRRGLLIEQASSQTANAIETRNNTGTALSYITSAGGAYFAGDVGIGTASPSTQLDVAGSGNFSGDVTITGHLSAATKSFLIDHPTREGHKLQYGSLESPYHGVRLTGKARVDNGWCVVKLPEYISELVHDNEDVNIQLTNYRHSKVLYVSDINVANNEFTVKCDSWFGNNGKEFFWTFTAVRKDVKELQVEF